MPAVPAPFPCNEAERIGALRRFEILDTEPEQRFDELTELSAALCKTPIALISLLDENRQWFKSSVGLDTKETSRELAFCGYTILQDDLFIVNDTWKA